MHTFTFEDLPGHSASFDYMAFTLLAALRYYVPFEGFRLFAQAGFGSARLFLRLQQDDHVLNPGTQALLGELIGGVDLPLGERFGVALQVGLRVQGNTETVPAYPGFTFTFSPSGVFWGLQFALAGYLRL
jgi:hypothetical protein